jgi:RHS repeat-associated protein
LTTTIDPPESSNDIVEISRNGLAQTSLSMTGVFTEYGHDDLGRLTTVEDPRTGTATRAYYGSGASLGSRGKLSSITDADSNTTSYAYETATGRLASIQYPDNDYQYYDYNTRGDRTYEWGANTYPVEYVFDYFGRKVQMSTYQGGSGWDTADDWANITTGTPDITTWEYEAATGLLLEKRPADYDSQAGGPKWVYTYTTEGKLETRTWARLVGQNEDKALITQYVYDGDTGEMTQIKYYHDNDQTPDPNTPWVTFAYDRAGRQETINDIVGQRTFAYRDDPQNEHDMQLATETIDGSSGGLYSKTVEYLYDASGDDVGRQTGFRIGTSSPYEYEVGYQYDIDPNTGEGTGRLNGVTGPGLSSNGVVYTWHDDSDLVKETLFKDGAGATKASAYREYEEKRDLIDHVENKAESALTIISKYDYVNDAMGRRVDVVHTGSAFAATQYVEFGYNYRSELDTADRWSNSGKTTHMASPFAWDYAYDHIGNRDTYDQDDSGTPTSYTANPLNQYTATSNPTEAFDHDDDGNMIEDGDFDYTWDAENRLISVTPKSPSNDDKMVVFSYDYMNRRVRKQVFVYASGWPQNPDEDWRFVYDEWNVVLVLDGTASNATQRKYTWGLDLSGLSGDASATGIHAAGGIGDLLAVEETATSGSPEYWFFYDANGNIAQVVNNATGYAIAAHYEYDPYGNVITSDGAYADDNPFRFSTKWFDTETGLGYWGYRYYSPELGRWMSRDPIEEEGGLSLYNYVLGRTINSIDLYGLTLEPIPPIPPRDCLIPVDEFRWYRCSFLSVRFIHITDWEFDRVVAAPWCDSDLADRYVREGHEHRTWDDCEYQRHANVCCEKNGTPTTEWIPTGKKRERRLIIRNARQYRYVCHARLQ